MGHLLITETKGHHCLNHTSLLLARFSYILMGKRNVTSKICDKLLRMKQTVTADKYIHMSQDLTEGTFWQKKVNNEVFTGKARPSYCEQLLKI